MPILRKPVVYTCLFGDYERLNEQPKAADSKIPFLCFTDRSDLKFETWSVRTIEPLWIDAARESRRPKILPHLFLRDFTESLYIDGTCILNQTPEEIFKSCLPRDSQSFVCLRHPCRDCAFDEAEEVLRCDMDSESRVREQMDHYNRSGFPRHAGLIASGFLLRRHSKEDVKKFAEIWFSHVLRYSKRDQLSFNFIAWKTGLLDAPSLCMWREYFSQAQIHGVDIQDFSNVESDRITFTRADPSDRLALSEVIQRCRYLIKLIIDDASHASRHQQTSLAALFPHLESGGLYFIEDLNDQPPDLEEAGAVKTRDFLRAISVGKPIGSDFLEQSEMDYLLANIADIQFYDSMDYSSAAGGQDALAVIRKK